MRLWCAVFLGFALPAFSAQCPGSRAPTPHPGICFECQQVEDFIVRSKAADPYNEPVQPSFVGNNFTCLYERNVTDSSDYFGGHAREGKLVDFYTRRFRLGCHYNSTGILVQGNTTLGINCPEQANRIEGCDLDSSSSFEICCSPNCKLETDNCFHCPKQNGFPWVEMTVTKNVLSCRYRFEPTNSGRVTDCNFGAANGTLIRDYLPSVCPPQVRAPQRASCLKANPSIAPATPLEHPYLICPVEGNCYSKWCFTCPKFPENIQVSDAVIGSAFVNNDKFICEYYNKGNYFGKCYYDSENGKLRLNIPYEGSSDSRCAPTALKDTTCKEPSAPAPLINIYSGGIYPPGGLLGLGSEPLPSP